MARRLVFALFLAFLASTATAQLESVGNLRFDTSASKEAQDHFLRGVAILHSFGWKQAIAEFQAAQKIEPDFALAYWGETLCYNHPLAPEQDGKTPREVLARLGDSPEARLAKAPTAAREGIPSRRRGALGGRRSEGRLEGPPRGIHGRDGAPPQ